jgi:chromatin structure-remodeling complex protein RSC7
MLTGNWSMRERRGKFTFRSSSSPALFWSIANSCITSRFNSLLQTARKENNAGIYEVHTNIMHYPAIMQPTHAYWEAIEPEPSTNGLAKLAITNGTTPSSPTEEEATEPSIFPNPPAIYTRNFLITDTLLTAPKHTSLTLPSTTNSSVLAPEHIGIPSLEDTPDDILALLPEDCKKAFLEERKERKEWAGAFADETTGGMRATLRVSVKGSL